MYGIINAQICTAYTREVLDGDVELRILAHGLLIPNGV